MNPAIARLDHLICEVPDIQASHHHFCEVLGFAEAWPIGPFWPSAQTSGVALGGINLEFIQPDQNPTQIAKITTLVFEPTTIKSAAASLATRGIRARIFEKIEPNPQLLLLRGFTDDEAQEPQLICTNLLLESDFAVPMFLCDYVPFLKQRLAPSSFPYPFGEVRAFKGNLRTPRGFSELEELGYLGDIRFEQIGIGESEITEIQFESGPIDLQGFPARFQLT